MLKKKVVKRDVREKHTRIRSEYHPNKTVRTEVIQKKEESEPKTVKEEEETPKVIVKKNKKQKEIDNNEQNKL